MGEDNDEEIVTTEEDDEEQEPEGITRAQLIDGILKGIVYLLLDTFFVFLLWNYAVVGTINGFNKITPFVAFCIILLARSLFR